MNPKIKSNISWQRIEDEVLIMDTAYQKKAHSLNSTASFIWEHCNGTNSIEDIAKLLSDNYETNLAESTEDVKEVINQLKSFDLLESF
ncbi:MAG: hypothetical protein COW01_01575 [Bdellovibrionales bacterium CG12_big_fil_rev_8_21_14_0_65_38_15]|nr:MAG: hypothetical protein COW79_00125 [Bdellovibrionales bacterium CG22_combo_CG10-13_8_21_14_all_38_13]PIQ57161.1 MAG: hypothetical protein COW01_01575 [Bdellovibrionales bacterium CG12_big_fil_rev_8_21_14_0_65_38_15]PIR31355.1 MAG: hypothetical protein COV38_00665 [Bdellovibrionales bacterium CG11_big_fil_rev_8_21_14_0_20_38_13]